MQDKWDCNTHNDASREYTDVSETDIQDSRMGCALFVFREVISQAAFAFHIIGEMVRSSVSLCVPRYASLIVAGTQTDCIHHEMR